MVAAAILTLAGDLTTGKSKFVRLLGVLTGEPVTG